MKDEIPLIYDDINRFNEPGVKFRWPNLQDFEDCAAAAVLSRHELGAERLAAVVAARAVGRRRDAGLDDVPRHRRPLPRQGSFLLIIGHVHAGFTNNNAIVIWWNAKNHVEMPESGFRDQLILQGWREVVAYSGDLEVKRLFGDPAEDAPEEGAEDVDGLLEGIFGDK